MKTGRERAPAYKGLPANPIQWETARVSWIVAISQFVHFLAVHSFVRHLPSSTSSLLDEKQFRTQRSYRSATTIRASARLRRGRAPFAPTPKDGGTNGA